MTRLPIPGADNGSWGDILNDFLRVEHNDDGTLKTSYLDSSQKGQAGGVAELDGGGTVPVSQLPAGAVAGDATAVQKGIMRLTGDLGGTADSPTVPTLANKADSSTVLLKGSNLSDLNNFTTARLNLGVAVGSDVQAWDAELDTWSAKTAPAGTVVGTTDSQVLTNKTLTSPVINTPTGITKSDVDLANVDDTSDASKPISTATQGALDLKANSTDLTAKVNKAGDTMTGQLNVAFNSTSSATIGDGANSASAISFQNRGFVGYDNVGYMRLQGGLSKGIQLSVNNNTFGTGSAFTIDTAGQVGIGVVPTASNGYLQLPSSTTLATGGIAWGTDTNLYRSAADTLRTDDNLIVAAAGTVANSVATIDATQTLTNKRITRRISSTASDAAPTPNADTTDVYLLTALATAATFGAPTGTPADGQSLIVRIKDDGTARTLGWNAAYRIIGTSLPTTTILGKTLYLGFLFNNADAKWDCLAISQEA